MAAAMEGSTASMSEDIFQYSDEIDDEQFNLIKRILSAKGKGRRPALPRIASEACSNKLLLQLYLLKFDLNQSWQKMQTFLNELFPDYPAQRLRTKIENAAREFKKCVDQASRAKFFSEKHNLNFAGQYLEKIGITRNDLLNVTPLWDKDVPPLTNSVVKDLELFRRKERLPPVILSQWIEGLCKQTVGSIQDKEATNAVKHVMDMDTKLGKSKARSPDQYSEFLSKIFCVTSNAQKPTTDVKRNSEITSSTGTPSIMPDIKQGEDQTPSDNNKRENSPAVQRIGSSDLPQKIAILQNQLRQEKARYEQQCQQLEEYSVKIKALQEHLKEYIHKHNELQEKMHEKTESAAVLTSELNTVRQANQRLMMQKAELSANVRKIKQAPFYKRLCRREAKLQQMERVLTKHQKGGCEQREESLKGEIKNLQSSLSKAKSLLEKRKLETTSLRKQVKEHNLVVSELEAELDEKESESVQTKTGNRYSDNIVKCVIQMVGEAEVPANRCGKIMQIVSKCLFNKEVDLCDLPSERSVLRFADQGHVLAKYHVADSVQKSSRFDFHLDGTTKDHRRYVGNQFTLASGKTLSTGFSTVFREDTETLLDQAIDLFKEVGRVYSCEEAQEQYKSILGKLTGIMSDRASVMKSFDRALDAEKSKVLSLEENEGSIHFLHCNAHFLLGLSNMCEDVLKKAEAEIGKKIGRDQLSVFTRFKSPECSSARYIRLACDILGPRGDEKNGCRDAWDAYCSMKDVKSRITSYRSNRFNNFFEGGAALHYHRSAIIDFLANFKGHLNLKQQSVLADATCDVVDTYIKAIGIVYYVVTGPYWKLVKSDTKYYDFYKYITVMHSSFKQWAQDPSVLLNEEPVHLWNDFRLEQDSMYQSLFTNHEESAAGLLKEVLRQIFSGFTTVTERQLADFLEGGEFHSVQNEKTKEALEHSKLTNLIGEACFGDLGFSMVKRRNATLHHHSTVNMIKRNHTMSGWFNKKSDTEQRELLEISRKKATELRQKHKDAQERVKAKAKASLEQNQKLAEEKEQAKQARKTEIVKVVKSHGGPCLSSSDVVKLLSKFKRVGEKKAALQAEIKYQKYVLGSVSKLLRVTGSCEDLANRLQVHLKEGDSYEEMDIDNDMESDNSLEHMEVEISDVLDGSDDDSSFVLEVFEPECVGSWVGVYYDEGVYVGQVLKVNSEYCAEVTFLEKSRIKKGAFCWPQSDDIDTIDAKFVIKKGITVESVRCGRSWNLEVPDIKHLEQLHEQYRKQYCTK